MDSYAFLTGLRWQDIIDIALLSYILFRLYILFRGTYVSRVIAGLAVIWCAGGCPISRVNRDQLDHAGYYCGCGSDHYHHFPQ